jgi:hypothetical protein
MKDTGKKLTGIMTSVLSFLLLSATAVGGFFVGKTFAKSQTDTTAQYATDIPLAVNDESFYTQKSNNGINLMSKLLKTAEYSEYGISTQSESARLLTAVVTPDYASNKLVDWSIRWANPSSDWATGKTVTDYITVTPTSDGALTAYVTCIQAFGEQAIVTVTSRSNSLVSTSAKIDYRKKPTTTTTLLTGSTSETKTWDIEEIETLCDYSDSWSIGTIDDSAVSHTVSVTTSDSLRNILEQKFTDSNDIKVYESTIQYTDGLTWEHCLLPSGGAQYGYFEIEGIFGFVSWTEEDSESDYYGQAILYSDKYQDLLTCLAQSDIDLIVTLTTTTKSGEVYTATYNINLDDESLTSVTSISGLNDIVF